MPDRKEIYIPGNHTDGREQLNPTQDVLKSSRLGRIVRNRFVQGSVAGTVLAASGIFGATRLANAVESDPSETLNRTVMTQSLSGGDKLAAWDAAVLESRSSQTQEELGRFFKGLEGKSRKEVKDIGDFVAGVAGYTPEETEVYLDTHPEVLKEQEELGRFFKGLEGKSRKEVKDIGDFVAGVADVQTPPDPNSGAHFENPDLEVDSDGSQLYSQPDLGSASLSEGAGSVDVAVSDIGTGESADIEPAGCNPSCLILEDPEVTPDMTATEVPENKSTIPHPGDCNPSCLTPDNTPPQMTATEVRTPVVKTPHATATPTKESTLTPPKKATVTPTRTSTPPKKDTPTPTKERTPKPTNTVVKKDTPTPPATETQPKPTKTNTPSPTPRSEISPTQTFKPAKIFTPELPFTGYAAGNNDDRDGGLGWLIAALAGAGLAALAGFGALRMRRTDRRVDDDEDETFWSRIVRIFRKKQKEEEKAENKNK